MVKLAELREIDDYLKSPKIDASEIDWDGEWVDEHYDGKRLNGVLVCQGKKYWYKAFDYFDEVADEYKRIMKYAVVKLTSAQTIEFENLQNHLAEAFAEQTAGFEDLHRHWHLPEMRADIKGYLRSMEERNKPLKEFDRVYGSSVKQLRAEIQNNDAIGWFERDSRD